MTRILDIRLGSSGRLDAIRRIEYLVLLVCAAATLFLQPYGYILAAPLVLAALMLVPGKELPAASREKQRLQALNDLQSQGLALRGRWAVLSEAALDAHAGVERWAVQRETVVWLSACKDRLRHFPEVRGIFEAHDQGEDIIEELDSAIATLSRLRRLVNLSESLKLPI